MTFLRRPIDADDLVRVQQSAGMHWSSYGGEWSIDEETGDCLYFVGCDVLDPTVPKSYTLLTNSRERVWSVETLEARYAPDGFFAALAHKGDSEPPQLLIVVSGLEKANSLRIPHEEAKSALEALFGHPLAVLYLGNWTELRAAQALAHEAWARAKYLGRHEEPVPFRRYMKELKPLGWMLLFAVFVLWLESARR